MLHNIIIDLYHNLDASSDFAIDLLLKQVFTKSCVQCILCLQFILFFFFQAGTSSEPCSEIYGGPSAQSELEVQAITAYILTNKPVYGAIDFHSYGQFVLFPHGLYSSRVINVWTPCIFTHNLQRIFKYLIYLFRHLETVEACMQKTRLL